MSSVSEVLQHVQAAAQAEANGDPAAHGRLLDEIHRLRLAAETPAERTMRMRFQTEENLCIRLALELGILQTIAAKDSATVTASELARECKADELLIIRIMRLVTYVGVCEEIGYGSYGSNDTTKFITTKGMIGGEKHHTDLLFPVGGNLVELIRTDRLHMFPEGPNEKSPFEHTFGKPLFEFMSQNAEQKEAFDDYMAARRHVNAPQWFEIYPAKDRLGSELKDDKDAALVVDVGGGQGHEISKFQKRFSHLRGRLILQDLPETFTHLDPAPDHVELMSHDFFREQPVKGARIYFLRQIMHDWPDKKCATILANIAKAMDPEYSRLLIDDYVLPDTGAKRREAGMDFLMMLFASGMERTRHQWEQLLDSVGLQIVKIWYPAEGRGEEPVIEAKLRS